MKFLNWTLSLALTFGLLTGCAPASSGSASTNTIPPETGSTVTAGEATTITFTDTAVTASQAAGLEIDGTALTQQLADAGKDGVKIISYDRLINGSPNVDYYVTFDNQKVGVQQGTSLLTGLGVLDADGKDTGKSLWTFHHLPQKKNAYWTFDITLEVGNEEAADTLDLYVDCVDGKTVTMSVKPGDKVITDKYAGTKVTLEDVEYIIVKQSDILAIVE